MQSVLPYKTSSNIYETEIDLQKLLEGRYEAERLPQDFSPERIVPDFAFNVLNPLGLLYRPVVDENYLAKGGSKPIWPEGKPFAVCLTHDVDFVSQYSLRQAGRRCKESLINGNSPEKRLKGLISFGLDMSNLIKHSNAKDPLHCYERWLEVEEKVSARSTFFFWPGWKAIGRHHHSDCIYELTDRITFDKHKCTVAEMIREIGHRGWEIGLHPSWYSFDDADEMKRQKAVLEMALEHDVVSVRQHFLHYDIRVTPRVQAEAGFKYDSTLGFNDNVGFRFGTSYPWWLYDLKVEADLPIMEIPLIIQDGALLNHSKGMRLDYDTAFKYIMQISEKVETVGGVLTLLWHPNYVNHFKWWALYIRILKYLSEKNAWFASLKEIGDWYQRQNIVISALRK